MFVYLDESGDTGFKFKQGSSSFFVVTLLLVDDPVPLHSTIDAVRSELGFDHNPEFKFSSSKPHVREKFLSELCRCDFSVRALVVDKRNLAVPHAQSREKFYSYLVRQVLQHDAGALHEATLILDRSVKSKRVQASIATYLRGMLNDGDTRKLAAIRYRDSKRDNLIQAVDMISGAIYARYHRNEERYYRLIGQRVRDLWLFDPRT